ncbi:MAG: hypothetical protein GYA47_06740 [Desulfovibrio sp.]|nr:hypothetical protein [Desulfovibrio sp.]
MIASPSFRPRPPRRPWRTPLALAALLTVLSVVPASAFDEQVVLECAFRRALSMVTCKVPAEFQFMGLRDGVYVYNVHFGSKFTEFYVQINEDMAVISSQAWNGRMASATIIRDYANGCVDLTLDPAPCSPLKTARCCGK